MTEIGNSFIEQLWRQAICADVIGKDVANPSPKLWFEPKVFPVKDHLELTTPATTCYVTLIVHLPQIQFCNLVWALTCTKGDIQIISDRVGKGVDEV